MIRLTYLLPTRAPFLDAIPTLQSRIDQNDDEGYARFACVPESPLTEVEIMMMQCDPPLQFPEGVIVKQLYTARLFRNDEYWQIQTWDPVRVARQVNEAVAILEAGETLPLESRPLPLGKREARQQEKLAEEVRALVAERLDAFVGSQFTEALQAQMTRALQDVATTVAQTSGALRALRDVGVTLTAELTDGQRLEMQSDLARMHGIGTDPFEED